MLLLLREGTAKGTVAKNEFKPSMNKKTLSEVQPTAAIIIVSWLLSRPLTDIKSTAPLAPTLDVSTAASMF